MNYILLLCLLVLLSLACATTKSKNIETTILSQNVTEQPSPKPTMPMTINDIDYVVTEFVSDKIKETTLERQPQEIIKYILQGELSEKKFGRSLKEIKVRVEDRDLNYDGIGERIMIAKFYGDKSVPVLYIFKSDNEKWNHCIFEIDLGYPDSNPFKVDFLKGSDKSNFDLIKVSDVYGDKEVLKDVTYYQMQNGKYERVECHKVEGSTEKVIPCDS